MEERSDGRLGYIPIPGMNDPSYRTTFEEVLGRHFDKEGIVIHIRSNGGGDLVADLEVFFSGHHLFENTTDDRSSGFEPSFRWTRPSVTRKVRLRMQSALSLPGRRLGGARPPGILRGHPPRSRRGPRA